MSLDRVVKSEGKNNLWRESSGDPKMFKMFKMKHASEKDGKPTVSLKFSIINFT